MKLSDALERLDIDSQEEKAILIEWSKDLEGLVQRQANEITASNKALSTANSRARRYLLLHNELGKRFAHKIIKKEQENE